MGGRTIVQGSFWARARNCSRAGLLILVATLFAACSKPQPEAPIPYSFQFKKVTDARTSVRHEMWPLRMPRLAQELSRALPPTLYGPQTLQATWTVREYETRYHRGHFSYRFRADFEGRFPNTQELVVAQQLYCTVTDRQQFNPASRLESGGDADRGLAYRPEDARIWRRIQQQCAEQMARQLHHALLAGEME